MPPEGFDNLPVTPSADRLIEGAQTDVIRNHAAFIWSVADLLRGDYKQSEYGKVILPLTVVRRMDCVLEPTKEAVLARAAELAGHIDNLELVLTSVAGEQDNDLPPDADKVDPSLVQNLDFYSWMAANNSAPANQ